MWGAGGRALVGEGLGSKGPDSLFPALSVSGQPDPVGMGISMSRTKVPILALPLACCVALSMSPCLSEL